MKFRCPTPIPPPVHPTYSIDQVIKEALEEDSGDIGDITTKATISEEKKANAWFLAKANGIVAGICVTDRVFEIVDPSLSVTWYKSDGNAIHSGNCIGEIEGNARAILIAERVCLNFMQRMSGIASLTTMMIDEIRSAGSHTRLLDTRKTVPGLRLLDKWAVIIGGGTGHRVGLFDMMMIKDNHIAAAGGLRPAIDKAHAYLEDHGLSDVDIEVETSTLEEVEEVKSILAAYGPSCRVTRVMLDNMTRWEDGSLNVDTLQNAIAALKEMPVELEASGNVTLETVGRIAATGVTFISCGALTHSVKATDISLKIRTH